MHTLIASDAFIIGHRGGLQLTPIAAIRPPEFLGESVGEFLFAAPWAYLAVLAGLGALAVYVSRSRGGKGTLWAGVAMVSLAAIWAITAWLIVTPTERLTAAHEKLLSSLAAKDVGSVMTVLAEDFQAPQLSINSSQQARPAIEMLLSRYPMRSNKISSVKTRINSKNATTTITIVTAFDSLPETNTAWTFEWEDQPAGDWRLSTAHLETINNRPPKEFGIGGGFFP